MGATVVLLFEDGSLDLRNGCPHLGLSPGSMFTPEHARWVRREPERTLVFRLEINCCVVGEDVTVGETIIVWRITGGWAKGEALRGRWEQARVLMSWWDGYDSFLDKRDPRLAYLDEGLRPFFSHLEGRRLG